MKFGQRMITLDADRLWGPPRRFQNPAAASAAPAIDASASSATRNEEGALLLPARHTHAGMSAENEVPGAKGTCDHRSSRTRFRP